MDEDPSSRARYLAADDGATSTARRFLADYREYLVALLATLGTLASVQVVGRKIDWRGLGIWLALAPPLLVFLFKTLPRLVKARRERLAIRRSRAQETAPQPAGEPLAGYFLIGPYPEERRAHYRRADGRHKIVLDWVRASGEPILTPAGSRREMPGIKLRWAETL